MNQCGSILVHLAFPSLAVLAFEVAIGLNFDISEEKQPCLEVRLRSDIHHLLADRMKSRLPPNEEVVDVARETLDA